MTDRLTSRSKWRRSLLVFALATNTIVLSACAEEVVAGPRYRGEVVTVAPPVVQSEVIGVAPHPGWIYQPGYWDWVGGRHVWVHGAWVAGRPGYRWEPHAWVREGNGWHLREGYWVRL